MISFRPHRAMASEITAHQKYGLLMFPRMSGKALLLLGERIRALRAARPGLTAQEVADAVGIGRGTLSSIESGKGLPGRDTLFALADYYGVSTEFIRTGEDGTITAPDPADFVQGEKERVWLDIWRRMSDRERDMMLAALTVAGRRGEAANGEAA